MKTLKDLRHVAGVSKAKLKEKLQSVLQKVAPSQEHEVIAVKTLVPKGADNSQKKRFVICFRAFSLVICTKEDLSEHIFKTLRPLD